MLSILKTLRTVVFICLEYICWDKNATLAKLYVIFLGDLITFIYCVQMLQVHWLMLIDISLFQPLGDLGTLDVDEKGEAFYSGFKEKLRIADLIGRAIVVYESEDKSDPGIKAAVIARSAGVGENYKKLCTCDGVTIWEANSKI